VRAFRKSRTDGLRLAPSGTDGAGLPEIATGGLRVAPSGTNGVSLPEIAH
jgi:hypothetical protein